MSDNDEPKFGELKEIPIREVWAHEAYDFTPWLADNIGALGDALGLSLRVKQTEFAVGKFSLDILAEEEDTERVVAIENQFHHTDHSHLGQLLTYAAGCEADILIWVVENVRDEHRAAVEWLNRKTDADTHCYLVEVKILRIGDSLPAYQLVPVVGSNKWQKETHRKAAVPTSEDRENAEYFDAFVQELAAKKFPYFLRNQRPTTARRDYWCVNGVRKWSYSHDFPAKKYPIGDVYVKFNRAYARQRGVDINKLREELFRRKKDIGGDITLDWNRRSKCVVRVSYEQFLSSGEKSLDEIRAWAVENIIKLAEAIPPALLQEISDAVEESDGDSE